MPTKLLRQIKNTLPELRKSEKLVADFVLKDPKSVVTMKTAEASSAIGISEPTLIRFCKALGFSGYQEFKINQRWTNKTPPRANTPHSSNKCLLFSSKGRALSQLT